MEEAVKLFGGRSSPFSCRVECALKLKGVKYEFIKEDPSNKSDLLLQYNPVHKKIPVLVHAGKPIVESLIILEYIDETWPERYPILPRILMKDPKLVFGLSLWKPRYESTFWSLIFATGETKEKIVNENIEVLKTLEEQALGDKRFFGGDDIGFLDLAIGTGIHWMKVVEDIKEVKLFETCNRLQAWFERFNDVPAVKESLPSHHELVAHYKSRMG
ncbi:hypothetical protein MKW92_007329 [Papaver armeniacum]|nr:hypothetical protein MKW92_007329 [Papaver armeniacum]